MKGVGPQSELGIKQLIDREVRKRLWCALCTEVSFSLLAILVRRSALTSLAGLGLHPLPEKLHHLPLAFHHPPPRQRPRL